MVKGSRGRRRIVSRQSRATPYPLPSYNSDISVDLCPKKCFKALDQKDWEDVTCSVCMECPHNAVLLLCSSHDNGCRPYMCGTSFQFSNCLDQYKKAYTKVISSNDGQLMHGFINSPILLPDSSWPVEKCEVTELACPLCRGQEQKKHVRAEHPSAQPREVDPILEQKWRRLEQERERNDVMSTIMSTMPGAVVVGDYVIESNHNHDFDTDEEDGGFDANAAQRNGAYDSRLVNVVLLLRAIDQNAVGIRHPSPIVGLDSSDQDDNNNSDDDGGGGVSLVSRLHRQGRVLLGRSGRRRRRRDSTMGSG
uniref:Uncharacterized protein n=1 Tax=Fagus sylvatica TaxID=28930 RepID=A0A2N9IFK7_FAGSY